MVGSGKLIPDKDEEIALSARRYLSGGFDYVILVDDLEHDHRDHAADVLLRYQQFPACGFRPENTLVLISHFTNSLARCFPEFPILPLGPME